MNTELTLLLQKWGVSASAEGTWESLLPLLERICEAKNAYFIFKIDGERSSRRLTFVLNLPFPSDAVIRKDVDSFEEGLRFLIKELASIET